ncbi:MAG: M48 family metallopeptidase [Verrucomicrobia bacterium]|nr:M48 family metallopeptidase [Verrucomicrobiota bacterium]
MELTPAKKTFPLISPRAWEHPADRAALNALRRVPGLDVAIRVLLGETMERSIRLMHLASAVRVGPRQFPRVYGIAQQVNGIFGVPAEQDPEIFVAQSPFLNAGAVGWKKPFVVLHSSLVESIRDDDELAGIYAHELGHILSGHVLYKTLLALLLRFSVFALSVPLSGLALTALVLALREWDRKSELSADRAGLLATQSLEVSQRTLMRLAGGTDLEQMNLDEFRLQAAEYAGADHLLDRAFKVLNLLNQTHPFAVLRLEELRKWAEGGDYQKILAGDFPTGRPEEPDLTDDVKDAGESYKAQWDASREAVKESFEEIGKRVRDAASGAGQLFKDVFRKKDDKDGE